MLSIPTKKEVQRLIADLENPYPADNLILNYRDFLKIRDYLHYYQFNPVVFDHLLHIAINEWKYEKRISRLSLLQTIRRYYYTSCGKYPYNKKTDKLGSYPFSVETRTQLFALFKKTFEQAEYISANQLEDARAAINTTLVNIELTDKAVKWYCIYAFHSTLILNRTLRYPVKSEIISAWAKENYKNDNIRARRPEVLGWIIDQDPHFEVDKSTLLDDFEHLNETEYRVLINQKSYDQLSYSEKPENAKRPEFKPAFRFYGIPMNGYSEHYAHHIGAIQEFRQVFYKNIDTIQKITMIWGIAYSRLDNKIKTGLLKKYYCKDTYHTLLKICIKTKNVELLKWISEQTFEKIKPKRKRKNRQSIEDSSYPEENYPF